MKKPVKVRYIEGNIFTSMQAVSNEDAKISKAVRVWSNPDAYMDSRQNSTGIVDAGIKAYRSKYGYDT